MAVEKKKVSTDYVYLQYVVLSLMYFLSFFYVMLNIL